MTTLHLRCAFCGETMDLEHEGGYASRYADCPACGKRFIYEPLRAGVRTLKPEDADSCSDPDRREIEMGGSCED
ncbi:MAG: hypothetical protein AB7E32_07415 [Desulfovibrio sp.]